MCAEATAHPRAARPVVPPSLFPPRRVRCRSPLPLSDFRDAPTHRWVNTRITYYTHIHIPTPVRHPGRGKAPGGAATTKPALLLAPHKLGAPPVPPPSSPRPNFFVAPEQRQLCGQATRRRYLRVNLSERSPRALGAPASPSPAPTPPAAPGEKPPSHPIPFHPIPCSAHPTPPHHRGTHRRAPQALRAAAAPSPRLPFSNFPCAERGCGEVYLYGERERGSAEDDKLFRRVLNQKGGWNRISPQYQDPGKSNPSPEEHSFRAVICIAINSRGRRHRIQIDPGSSLYWWLPRAPGSYCSGAGKLQSAAAASGHGLGGGEGGRAPRPVSWVRFLWCLTEREPPPERLA